MRLIRRVLNVYSVYGNNDGFPVLKTEFEFFVERFDLTSRLAVVLRQRLGGGMIRNVRVGLNARNRNFVETAGPADRDMPDL